MVKQLPNYPARGGSTVRRRPTSAEPTGDVVLGEAVARVGEQAIGLTDLDQLAEMEVRRALRHTCRLLHGVGDDHDRVGLAQLIDQVLDARGGDRIERRARLVHEYHLRLHGDGARNAEALLLAPRESGAGAAEAILDLFPQPGAREARADDLIEMCAAARHSMDARS